MCLLSVWLVVHSLLVVEHVSIECLVGSTFASMIYQ